MNFDADIDVVFFDDFAEPMQVGAVTHKVIMDQDLEVVDADGTVNLVEYAATVKKGVLMRGIEFSWTGKQWITGQALERSVDGKLMTFEVAST